MTLPDLAYTRDGEPVTSLEEHKGLIRGTMVAGTRQDGSPVVQNRYWYPSGQLTPARRTKHDLELGG